MNIAFILYSIRAYSRCKLIPRFTDNDELFSINSRATATLLIERRCQRDPLPGFGQHMSQVLNTYRLPAVIVGKRNIKRLQRPCSLYMAQRETDQYHTRTLFISNRECVRTGQGENTGRRIMFQEYENA